MEASPMNAVGLDGSGNPSSGPAREVRSSVDSLDEEIVGVKRQIAANNPFMRALGIAPEAMFTFLNMWDANTLKLVSKLAREDVRNAFWSVDLYEMERDKLQRVTNLKKWRQAYPNALSATLSTTAVYPSEDYVHLRGVRYLHLHENESITDVAFDHFQTFNGSRGIHTLDMSHCWQITDKAFANLRGVHTLNMFCCRQITDKAFEHLRGVHTLNMLYCWQITDTAFENLQGIHTLYMGYCSRITDKAFVNLRGIHTLNMSCCRQITDASFVNLRGIHTLAMAVCSDSSIAAAKRVLGSIPRFVH
jgi:hypothetical protein